MNSPSVLTGIFVDQATDSELGVFSKNFIYRGTVIEFCAWLPVTQKLQILINNNDKRLSRKLFPNPDGMAKEEEFAAKLSELELQRRLDEGLLTPEQLRALLTDIMDPKKLLTVDTHGILLGYGSIYRQSSMPNINWEYDKSSKLYKFFTVQDIQPGQELTYFIN